MEYISHCCILPSQPWRCCCHLIQASVFSSFHSSSHRLCPFRRPVRVIEMTFTPAIVEYFPDPTAWQRLTPQLFVCGEKLVSWSVMDLLPNLLGGVSVTQTNPHRRCSPSWILGAVTACQHGESASINHDAFDQNAANLYCFLWWKDRKAALDLLPLIGLVRLMAI